MGSLHMLDPLDMEWPNRRWRYAPSAMKLFSAFRHFFITQFNRCIFGEEKICTRDETSAPLYSANGPLLLFPFFHFFCVLDSGTSFDFVFFFIQLFVRVRGETTANPLSRKKKKKRILVRRKETLPYVDGPRLRALWIKFLFIYLFLAPADHQPDGNRKERNINLCRLRWNCCLRRRRRCYRWHWLRV